MDIRESVKKMLEGDVTPAAATVEELSKKLMAAQKEFIDKIAEVLGVDAKVKLAVEQSRRRNELRVTIASDNIIDACGPMESVFKKVTVADFGGSIKQNEKGEWVAWIPVSLSWESHRGGTNGGDVMTAWFNFDSGVWQFETAAESYKPRED